MEPSDREIWRSLDQVGDDPDEPDAADIWEAALENTHPKEMDTLAEERALRKMWATLFSQIEGTRFGPEDISSASDDEIEKFDEAIRVSIENPNAEQD